MKREFTILVAMAVVLIQQPTLASPPVQKYQPLSVLEKKSACQSALSRVLTGGTGACDGIVANKTRLQRTLPPGPDSTALNNTELLLIERRLSDKNNRGQGATRHADVYTYNYQTDTLTHTVINLANSKVLHSEDVQNVQLPLTEDEISRSRVIASNDQTLRTYLTKEYAAITGKTLRSLDQLEVKAFVFLAKSMPGQVSQAALACGLHRCARLVMHTPERIALETAPVIDLSAGIVVQHKTGE